MLSKSLDDLRGWIERCVAFSLHSIVMWNKVPVLPVRNKINLTGGRLSKLLIVFIWHVFTPLVVCLEHECKVLKQISVELYDPVQSYWFKVVCMVTEKKLSYILPFKDENPSIYCQPKNKGNVSFSLYKSPFQLLYTQMWGTFKNLIGIIMTFCQS